MIKLQTNGTLWRDTDGNELHAHGGHIISYNGWYYWYGEDRRDNIYVSVYRSRNLVNWEFRSHCLTTSSKFEPIPLHTDSTLSHEADGKKHKVNIERPKVLYNKLTNTFVMWAHYENGLDYRDARICIATSKTPDGFFTYRGSFNPFGNMSRDCTLFFDEISNDAFFISASRDNADLAVYRLTDDYLNVDEKVRTLFQGEYREAPAMFYRHENGKYYILTSHCTGWAPNQGKCAIGNAPDGRFSLNELFGDDTTYHSQPAFVLPYIKENGETEYLYFADRWCGGGEKYFLSSYIVLPIKFDINGHASIEWCDNCEL
jgi:hypothetical protein